MGCAFDVYHRLLIDPEKIKTELLKEFCREGRNRDETLDAIMHGKHQPGESTQRYAYRILRLVGLAYSTMDGIIKGTIAKKNCERIITRTPDRIEINGKFYYTLFSL